MVNNDVKQLKNMAEKIQRKDELVNKLNSSKELFKKYMDASCMPSYETFECKELKDYDNKNLPEYIEKMLGKPPVEGTPRFFETKKKMHKKYLEELKNYRSSIKRVTPDYYTAYSNEREQVKRKEYEEIQSYADRMNSYANEQKEKIQGYEKEINELNQIIEEFDLVKKQSKDVVHLNEIASFIEEGRADNLEEALYLSSFSDLFREVEKNMASLKQEMEKIHEKVNYLEDDVDDFDYEIEDMKKEFESINEEISDLQSGVNDAIDRADQAYDYAVSNG